MRPEPRIESSSLRNQPAIRACPMLERLSLEAIHSGAIGIMARSLDPATLEAFDAIAVENLPRLRLNGTIDLVHRALNDGLLQAGFGPKWLADWLLQDTVFLARLYQDMTQAKHIRLRLETVEDDSCRRFHADNVRFRLATTYRGPGTEWIVPGTLAGDAGEFPADSIRHLGRGHVAIMRGTRESTADKPGLLHRSPPLAGSGIVRLFLAIDEAAGNLI
jgi:hypothetical protein